MDGQASRRHSSDAEFAVVVSIHALATTEPERWGETIAAVGELLGAEKALLFSPTAEAADTPGAAVHLDPEILAEYAQHWHRYDVWTHRLANRGWVEEDSVLRGEELVEHRDFVRSTVYNECLRHNGVGRLMTGIVATSSHTAPLPAMVCAFYRDAGRNAFSHRAASRFRRLLPHLRQAINTFGLLQQASTRALLAEAALEVAGTAYLLLDKSERVVFANAEAEAVLGKSQALAYRCGRLRAAGRDRKGFAAILAAARSDRNGATVIDDGAGPLRLTAVPVPVPVQERLATRNPSVMLLLEPVDASRPSSAVQVITTRHALTPAESRVLDPLLAGRGPKQIAEELGLSLNTVQTHLKRIFAKTGTSSQRELVAVALRL